MGHYRDLFDGNGHSRLGLGFLHVMTPCSTRGLRSGDRLMALRAKKEGSGQRLLDLTVMTTNTAAASPVRGRPVATSHADIEQAAFRLYAERGFEGTTIEAIAAA